MQIEGLVRNEAISLNMWLLVAMLLAALCYAIVLYTQQLAENVDETDW